jgi:hypothetical protein
LVVGDIGSFYSKRDIVVESCSWKKFFEHEKKNV